MFLTKNKLLKKKKQLTAGLIIDAEIEVEVNWILIKEAEKEIKNNIDKIEKILEEIKEEKAKTPCAMEEIKKLNAEAVRIGYTGKKTKDGKEKYEGALAFLDNKRASIYSGIEMSVGKREQAKLQLRGINRLINKGYHKDFNKFINEEL